GRGKKVTAGCENDSRSAPQGDAYECIRRLLVRLRMILADADEPPAPIIDHAIRIPPVAFRSERNRLFPRKLPVKSLIHKVAEIDGTFMYRVCPAAVFMNAGASVERGRRDVLNFSIGALANDDISSFFRRSRLDPVQVVAIHDDLLKTD